MDADREDERRLAFQDVPLAAVADRHAGKIADERGNRGQSPISFLRFIRIQS